MYYSGWKTLKSMRQRRMAFGLRQNKRKKETRDVLRRLEIIRVYSKAPGQEADFTAPFVLKKGSTVAEMAGKVHQDFVDRFKTARIWFRKVYDGQLVQRHHLLEEGDVVELRI